MQIAQTVKWTKIWFYGFPNFCQKVNLRISVVSPFYLSVFFLLTNSLYWNHELPIFQSLKKLNLSLCFWVNNQLTPNITKLLPCLLCEQKADLLCPFMLYPSRIFDFETNEKYIWCHNFEMWTISWPHHNSIIEILVILNYFTKIVFCLV